MIPRIAALVVGIVLCGLLVWHLKTDQFGMALGNLVFGFACWRAWWQPSLHRELEQERVENTITRPEG